MTELTITHTSAEGTLIEGTSRGDGSAEILKVNGWRWGRSIASWYVPHSRDRAPKHGLIAATAAALAAAGFTVEQDIDAAPRDQAAAEAARQARSQERAEALNARAAKHQDVAQQAYDGVRQIADQIPFGQPILVGHHSEARARRDQGRMHRGMDKAVRESEYAEELSRRAGEAAAATGARHNPVTVGNRIDRLGAELRRLERAMSRHQRRGGEVSTAREEQLSELIAHTRTELAYWQEVRQQHIESGKAGDFSAATVKPGDKVKINGWWWTVARSNHKTVAVQTEYSWTNRYPWHKVTDHRPAAQ
ncbi:hypothetical protein GCM10027599_23610 [Yimella radicis]